VPHSGQANDPSIRLVSLNLVRRERGRSDVTSSLIKDTL
jgi:hypothetical protein